MSAAEALAPERSVDEVRESLSVTEKGQPANTIGNCRTVFCHDPLLRDAIRVHGIGIITVPEKHNTTGTLLSHSIRTITVTG